MAETPGFGACARAVDDQARGGCRHLVRPLPGAIFQRGRRRHRTMTVAATRIREEAMANAKGFEPDVKIRARDYRIGCIGAGMIMAECHLAAYKEAGFPVAAIASRTKANAEKVATRWGIPEGSRYARGADRGPDDRDPRHRLSARPAAGADPPRAAADAHQGDPRAEAAGDARSTRRSRLRDEAAKSARSSRSTRTCASTSRCAC